MVLPGHIAGGYLTATALLAVFHPDLSVTQLNTLLLIGTISGELPDIDLIFFNIKHKKDTNQNNLTSESHRDFITHIPLFWLILSSIIFISGIIFGSLMVRYIGILVFGGTLSHLLLDSIEYGVKWLAPWSNKRNVIISHTLSQPKTENDRPGSLISYFHFIIHTYWKTVTIWCELLITIVALFVFFKSF